MNSKIIYAIAACAALSAGCSTMYDNNAYQSTAPMSAEQRHTDAKILKTVMVLNKNEIAAAGVAQSKTMNSAVRNYAQLMSNEHGRNLQETENLSHRLNVTPEPGNSSNMLQRQGKQELAMLKRLNSHSFDRAYINAMVKDHSAALQLFDSKLIPQASNPQLRMQLQQTRGHIASHLQQARAIQQQMS